jgi:hypothetical protein
MTSADLRPQGALAIWNEIDPAHEAEYHRWYWEQHLPERLSVPGFLQVCRYRAVREGPTFFTWYLVRDVEVLSSATYLERLGNPTEWTRRVMPWLRDMMRCACRITVDAGRGIGGVVATLRLSGSAGADPDLQARLARYGLQFSGASEQDRAVTRLQLWETDRDITVQRSAEHGLRGGPDRVVDKIVVLHSFSPDLAYASAMKLRTGVFQSGETSGLDGPFVYTLMHCLSA